MEHTLTWRDESAYHDTEGQREREKIKYLNPTLLTASSVAGVVSAFKHNSSSFNKVLSLS